jgi:hypothetical protein
MRRTVPETTWSVGAAIVVVLAILARGGGEQAGIDPFSEMRQPSIGSVGAVEEQRTIRYQIFVTGGDRGLSAATVSSVMPVNTVLLGLAEAPAGVTFAGNEGGTLTWTIDAMPAGASIGPVSVVVQLQGGETEAPASIYARPTWADGAVQTPMVSGVLKVVA